MMALATTAPSSAPVNFFDFGGSGGAGIQDTLVSQLTEAVGVALPWAASLLALMVAWGLLRYVVYAAWSDERAANAQITAFERGAIAALSEDEYEDEPDDDGGAHARALVAGWNDEHGPDPTDDDDEDGGGNDPHDDVGDVMDSEDGDDI